MTTLDLPPGRWERHGLIDRYVVTPPVPRKRGPKPRPERYVWTNEQDVCDAHTRYLYGVRDDYVREGERVYQRNKKREERRARRAMTSREVSN
ncbi:hypothetical protein GCM10022234_00600 [Aeromicrobium panaciterrae]|uniref:hypothetical protein n=1 Tax=Aeromicrobium panaciterrae TaxID=363861 RepID=UPI0031DA8747